MIPLMLIFFGEKKYDTSSPTAYSFPLFQHFSLKMCINSQFLQFFTKFRVIKTFITYWTASSHKIFNYIQSPTNLITKSQAKRISEDNCKLADAE